MVGRERERGGRRERGITEEGEWSEEEEGEEGRKRKDTYFMGNDLLFREFFMAILASHWCMFLLIMLLCL